MKLDYSHDDLLHCFGKYSIVNVLQYIGRDEVLLNVSIKLHNFRKDKNAF